jgi:hypothetical protein
MRIIGLAIVAATAFGVWLASTVAQSNIAPILPGIESGRMAWHGGPPAHD